MRRMRIFSGIQPTGDEAPRQLLGGFRQYAATQEQRRGVLLHRRPALDHASSTTRRTCASARSTSPRCSSRPGSTPSARRSSRRATCRRTPRRPGCSASVTSYGQLGRMTQFKEKSDRQRVRLGRALHLPGADGRRHPALPDRHRPDRRRPAPAPRARARRRRALQRALRRDVQSSPRASIPRSARGSWTSRSRRRRCRRRGGTPQGTVQLLDQPDVIRQEVPLGGHRLGPRGPARAEDKPGVTNLIDILAVADRRGAPRRSRPRYDGAGYGQFKSDVGEAVVEARRRRPGALPRAARRPGRAAAPARARRREGARGVGADARGDVRADGLRQDGLEADADALQPPPTSSAVSSRHSPGLERRRRRAPRRRSGAGAVRGGRPPRTSAAPGGSGPRAGRARGGCAEPAHRAAGAVDPSSSSTPSASLRERPRRSAPSTSRPRRPSRRRSAGARAGARAAPSFVSRSAPVVSTSSRPTGTTRGSARRGRRRSAVPAGRSPS